MALSGNKGEWSEIYAFFKLLSDGKIHSADGRLNKIDKLFYIIKEIIRLETNVGEYNYIIQKNSIRIAGDTKIIDIKRDEFTKYAKLLYDYIIKAKPSKGEMLSFADVEAFMNSVRCYSLKAKSQDKADIRMIIHDMRSGMEHKLGFSIKSKLGGKSTLFNSNKDTTNFLYKITGLNKEQIAEFNNQDKFADKFDILKKYNGDITFERIVNETFNNNLIYIDSNLPTILGHSLIEYYSNTKRSTADIVEQISNINPCGFPDTMDFYAHKIKQMLITFALGMTSANPWSGRYDANGGYIVVKEDGDIVCYHFYDRNDLEDYLYFNTGFETPSTTRHQFGNIFEENGSFWLKLNLQIRFIH